MNRKKIFSRILYATLLVGFGALLVPFISSLGPNIKAESALHRIDISKLKNGELLFMDHPNYGESIRGYDWGVMIYKRHNGNILAFDVSMKGDSVGLPDRHWWIPGRECFNFGPSKTNGKIDESKPIKCHDDLGAKKGWFPDFEWSIEGKSIKGGMMDMISTRGVVEGSYFIFGKSN